MLYILGSVGLLLLHFLELDQDLIILDFILTKIRQFSLCFQSHQPQVETIIRTLLAVQEYHQVVEGVVQEDQEDQEERDQVV